MASTVVIAVDASEYSNYCVDYYLKRLHRPENKVKFVHVPEYWGDMAYSMSRGTLLEVYNKSQADAQDLKQKYTQRAESAGINAEFVIEEDREPWTAIIKVAETSHADMIVMGSRGMGKIRRTLVGSVSDSVLHHCHIPVMIVQHPKHK